jgi:hypothetical protein
VDYLIGTEGSKAAAGTVWSFSADLLAVAHQQGVVFVKQALIPGEVLGKERLEIPVAIL